MSRSNNHITVDGLSVILSAAKDLALAVLLFCSLSSARAQLQLDTTRGLIGQEVKLPIRYNTTDTLDSVRVSGTLHLSNATVFFPERFLDADTTLLHSWTLKRLSDSVYDFSFVATTTSLNGGGDTIAFLAGEALAGFDSVCIVTFFNLSVNDQPAPDIAGRIVTESIGPPLPYIRFATLERNYPNPIRSGSTTTWAFRIDQASNVTFHFYNVIGEERFTENLGLQTAGIHTFSFTPTFETATGLYIVRMETGTGDAYQFMHVIR